MKLEIIFTPKAKDTFSATILFIKAKWGERSAEKFVKRTYEVLDVISEQPYIFKMYQANDVRKGLITKYTSVIYRITNNRIDILFFWDNRQDPII